MLHDRFIVALEFRSKCRNCLFVITCDIYIYIYIYDWRSKGIHLVARVWPFILEPLKLQRDFQSFLKLLNGFGSFKSFKRFRSFKSFKIKGPLNI